VTRNLSNFFDPLHRPIACQSLSGTHSRRARLIGSRVHFRARCGIFGLRNFPNFGQVRQIPHANASRVIALLHSHFVRPKNPWQSCGGGWRACGGCCSCCGWCCWFIPSALVLIWIANEDGIEQGYGTKPSRSLVPMPFLRTIPPSCILNQLVLRRLWTWPRSRFGISLQRPRAWQPSFAPNLSRLRRWLVRWLCRFERRQ
jgi:hypothetical protein